MKKLLIKTSIFILFFIAVENPLHSATKEDIEKKISDTQKKLKDYDEKILQEKSKLEKLKKDKGEVLSGIKKLNRLIEAKSKELDIYKREYEKNQSLLNELQGQITQQTGKLSETKKRLGKRLRAVYKQGKFHQMEVIYNSENYLEFLHKIKILQIISRNDKRLIERFNNGIMELETVKRNLTDSRNKSLEIFEKMKKAEKEILLQKNEKERLLAQINSDEKKRIMSIAKTEEDSKKLQDLINSLITEKIAAQEKLKNKKSFGKPKIAKGNLPWPIQGSIVKFFGKQIDNELNTYFYNRGITIKTHGEKKFTSVLAGTILYADDFSGYGKLIIIDHGSGFYSVYGYGKELYVKIDEKITQGKILGKVDGELYFEVRHKGNSQDPMSWLKKE